MKKLVTMLIVLLFGAAGVALGQTYGKTPEPGAPAPSQEKQGVQKGPEGKESGKSDLGPSSTGTPGMQDGKGMQDKGKMGKMPAKPSKDVREAQQQLKDAGFDPGRIDGILGPHTRSALKKFQRDKGMKVTGRLDSQTKQALMSAQARPSPGTGPMPQAPMTQPGPGAPPEEKSSPGATPKPTESVPGGSGSTGSRSGS